MTALLVSLAGVGMLFPAVESLELLSCSLEGIVMPERRQGTVATCWVIALLPRALLPPLCFGCCVYAMSCPIHHTLAPVSLCQFFSFEVLIS
jgi:hypothetical protein